MANVYKNYTFGKYSNRNDKKDGTFTGLAQKI